MNSCHKLIPALTQACESLLLSSLNVTSLENEVISHTRAGKGARSDVSVILRSNSGISFNTRSRG